MTIQTDFVGRFGSEAALFFCRFWDSGGEFPGDLKEANATKTIPDRGVRHDCGTEAWSNG